MSGATPGAARRVSVVVATCDRAPSLERLLQALEQQDHPDVEVVVVAGPSADGTAAVLAGWAGRIKVVDCAVRNLSTARNLGIAAAAGDLVAFIDDDAYPEAAWLDDLVPAFDDDEVAGAGGPVWDRTGARLQAAASVANRLGQVWTVPEGDPSAWLGDPHGDAFAYTIGTNAVFRRDRLVAIGGFDEEFAFYLDETDVCRRLLDAGWLVRTLDRGHVVHQALASGTRTDEGAVHDRSAVLRSRAYFALKHRGAHYSEDDAWFAFELFRRHEAVDVERNVLQGRLVAADVGRFERAVAPAMADATAAVAGGGRAVTTWPAPVPAWRPLPRLRPAGGKLTVALLSPQVAPGPVHGIGRVVAALAASLAARGHDVHVLTDAAADADADHVALEDGVWVHRTVVRPGPEGPERAAWPEGWDRAATVLAELQRLHRRRPVDVVQVPNWDSPGRLVWRDGTWPVVLGAYTPLATVIATDERLRDGSVEFAPLLDAEREGYACADAVLACGPAVVAEVEARTGTSLVGRVHLAPHGLVPGEPGAAPPAPPTGAEVLFVGRLEPRKGIATWLAAVPALARRCPQATFHVVGDDTVPSAAGPTYRQLFAASAEGRALGARVRFAGQVDDATLAAAYRSAAVVVVPSRYESFGLIALEAMGAARVVVAADVGGLAEVVVDGVTGRTVAPDDPAAWVEAVAALLGDHAEARRLAVAGWARAQRDLTSTAMVEQVERCYRAVLAQRA